MEKTMEKNKRLMYAFHGDPAIKQKYLVRVRAHRAADEIIHGVGWLDGKGCAIGCTLDNYDHSRYPTELGIPEMLACLEDTIFEGLKNGKAQEWPEQFLEAIRPGADLSRVGWKFLHWLLTESKIGAFDHDLVRDAVQQCAAVIEPLTRGEKADGNAAESARSAAMSAARSAESAARSAWSAASAAESAWSASWSAESAESAWSAESAESASIAAESAASEAWSAARSAESAANAAESEAWSAESAESEAWSAESEAWSAAYEKMAAHLLTLLREAN
jgi:hypothetical protein